MAKMSYKIPSDLNKTFTDMEIAISNSDGVGIKPLPMRVIIMYVFSGLICFWSVTNTFIGQGPVIVWLSFIIVWVILTFVLARYDSTKQMQAQLIPAFMEYIPKSNRYLITRTSSKATSFYQLVGIESVSSDGFIRYIDGTCAYAYRVVGSASILLFDSDRNAILDRVDMFYRKFPPEAEIITVTDKESQKIYHQINALQERYDNLQVRNPDLLNLLYEQHDILENDIGGHYRSIHQYMLIKADNEEMLIAAKNVLQSEVENSGLMIRKCVQLDREDVFEFLSQIYQK